MVGLKPGAVELVDHRTETSKQYQNPDGTFTAVIGAGPLHFRETHSGPWLDPEEMVVQRAGPATWTVTTTEIHISANVGSMTLTHLPTNTSWQWVYQGAVVGPNGEVVYDGVPWQYTPSPWGVKSDAVVESRRGPKVYDWIYLTGIPNPTVNEDGDIVAGRFVIRRPFVIGANGERYETSAWDLSEASHARFSFDDSGLPGEAFPYVIDPSTTVDLYTTNGDMDVAQEGSSYPPNDFGRINPIGLGWQAQRSFTGSAYVVGVGLLRFATSSLGSVFPTAASLRIYPNVSTSADIRSLVVERISADPWSADLSKYVLDAPASPLVSIPISDIPTGTMLDIPLPDPLHNIETHDDTAFRLHITGGQPTGVNRVHFKGRNDTTENFPRLYIEYSSIFSGTVTDADTSQGISGAEVRLSPGDYTTTTGVGGSLDLDVPPGTYTATISHPDYRTQTRTITITGNQPTILNVSLHRVYVGAGAVSRASSGSISLALPTGRQVGDLLVCYVTASSATSTLATPTGWSVAVPMITGTASRSWVFYKHVDGFEANSLSVSPSGFVARSGYIVAYRGVDPSGPIGAYGSNTGSTASRSAPSVTTSRDRNWVLRLWRATMSGTFSTPTGHNRRVQGSSTPSVALDDIEVSPEGASGTATSTSSATGNGIFISLEIVLEPTSVQYDEELSTSGAGSASVATNRHLRRALAVAKTGVVALAFLFNWRRTLNTVGSATTRIQRGVSRIMPLLGVGEASFTPRAVMRFILSTIGSGLAALQYSYVYNRLYGAVSGGTTSLKRWVEKRVNVAPGGTLHLIRDVKLRLLAEGAATVAAQPVRAALVVLSTVGSSLASLRLRGSYKRMFSLSGSETVSLRRLIRRPISVASGGISALTRAISRHFLVDGIAQTTVQTISVVLLFLSATSSHAVSLIRRVRKPLRAVGAGSTSLLRRVGKLLSRPTTAAATLRRHIDKRLQLDGQALLSIDTMYVILRTFSTAAATLVSFRLQPQKPFNVIGSGTASLRRRIRLLLRHVGEVGLTFGRFRVKELTVVGWGLVSLRRAQQAVKRMRTIVGSVRSVRRVKSAQDESGWTLIGVLRNVRKTRGG